MASEFSLALNSLLTYLYISELFMKSVIAKTLESSLLSYNVKWLNVMMLKDAPFKQLARRHRKIKRSQRRKWKGGG